MVRGGSLASRVGVVPWLGGVGGLSAVGSGSWFALRGGVPHPRGPASPR